MEEIPTMEADMRTQTPHTQGSPLLLHLAQLIPLEEYLTRPGRGTQYPLQNSKPHPHKTPSNLPPPVPTNKTSYR
jgi:hypothetical protein